jgi:hypothetical protein
MSRVCAYQLAGKRRRRPVAAKRGNVEGAIKNPKAVPTIGGDQTAVGPRSMQRTSPAWQFELRRDTTVFGAIAMAGSLNDSAKHSGSIPRKIQ